MQMKHKCFVIRQLGPILLIKPSHFFLLLFCFKIKCFFSGVRFLHSPTVHILITIIVPQRVFLNLSAAQTRRKQQQIVTNALTFNLLDPSRKKNTIIWLFISNFSGLSTWNGRFCALHNYLILVGMRRQMNRYNTVYRIVELY